MDQSSHLATKSTSQQKTVSPRASRKGHGTCQQCQTTLTIPVDNPERDDRLYLQCPCGMKYEIIAGSRRYKRKTVQMTGTYQDINEAAKAGEMIVENISFGGLSFRTNAPHTLARRDRLNLQFVLDDGSQTCISEPVKVRYVNDDIIGAVFSNAEAFTSALAAYLIR